MLFILAWHLKGIVNYCATMKVNINTGHFLLCASSRTCCGIFSVFDEGTGNVRFDEC